jgi:putative lipoprotein
VKRALAAAAITFALLSSPAAGHSQTVTRPQDAWFGPDKVKHFFIAGFIESVAFAGAEAAGARRSSSLPAALSVVAAISIGREVHDRRTKGLFSVRDLAFDALGATAAFFLLRHTQR